MKKSLFTFLLAGSLMLGVTACGGNATTPATETTEATEAQTSAETEVETETETKVEETESEAPEDDGIIDFTTDDFHIKYVKHEFGTDYEGNKCLLYYYEYTNTSDENATAGFVTNVQCFQDGSECEMAITTDRNDSMDNYAMNEVQPGGTVEVCQAYVLKSDTELTIEASELLSFDDEKDTQKITVE